MPLAVSTLRTLFNAQVFTHADILAITDKAFNYNVSLLTEKNINALKYGQEINFFTYLLLRSIDYEKTSLSGNGDAYAYKYEVLISYYKEVDILGNSHNNVIDAMETLDNTIRIQLGFKWDANVDTSEQSNTNLPTITNIQNYQCWTSSVLWIGYKYN